MGGGGDDDDAGCVIAAGDGTDAGNLADVCAVASRISKRITLMTSPWSSGHERGCRTGCRDYTLYSLRPLRVEATGALSCCRGQGWREPCVDG